MPRPTTLSCEHRTPVAARACGVLALGALCQACAAGAPLMHPAHTLPESRVDMGFGLTQSFGDGDTTAAISSARQSTEPGATPTSEEDFFRGAALSAALPLELSALVVGRVGLGGNWEAGISATGRTLRIDGRRSFESDDGFALSIGAAGSAIYRLGEAKPEDERMAVGRFDGNAVGYGAGGFGLDVPILVGWRNRTDLIGLWLGARGGYERMWGNMNLADPSIGSPAGVESNRFWGAGLVGASMGIDPVWIRFEFEASVHSIDASASLPAGAGDPDVIHGQFGAFAFTPSAAIVGKF